MHASAKRMAGKVSGLQELREAEIKGSARICHSALQASFLVLTSRSSGSLGVNTLCGDPLPPKPQVLEPSASGGKIGASVPVFIVTSEPNNKFTSSRH